MADRDIKEIVKEKYGKAALQVVAGGDASCCSGSACGERHAADPITSNLYSANETAALPADAVSASLGCGNPTALAELRAGESCSTWVRAAESMCCCRPSAWDRPGKPTAST